MKLFSSGKGTIDCRIILLDNSEQKHCLTNKSLGDELLAKVFVSLDLYEREYFGLRFKDINGNSHWLDPAKIVKKQVLNHNAPVYTFYFSVKFYAADPTKLREEITRYQFFMQIKKDILQGRIWCEPKIASELCAYAVQSELGDFEPNLHSDDVISQFRLIPNQTKDFEAMVLVTFQKLRGLVPADAERKFLERVKWLELYGVELFSVKGQDHMDYSLGLSPTGIVLFKNKNKIGSFIWPKITKLKYKGNCFHLRATQGMNEEEKEYTFLSRDKDGAKTLWKSCAEHHTFFRLEKANDVPASAHNFLFRKGSTFRFSGRTQQEIEREVDSRPRIQPSVHRVPSQRYERSDASSHGGDSSNHNIRGSGLPAMSSSIFDDSFRVQSGLYSNGQRSSFPSRPGSSGVERRMSPKFNSRSGYSSSGEAEQKRRRNQYYSGYTSAGENEGMQKNISRFGSAPNVQMKTYMHDNNFDPRMQHRQTSREYLPMAGSNTPHGYQHHMRRQHVSGSKSDSEESNRRQRKQRYHYHHGDTHTDSEMVAPLDVYHNTPGVVPHARPNQRYRHQTHAERYRHSGYDPHQAEVLLELGPNSLHSGSDKENSFTGTPRSVHHSRSHTSLHNYPPQQQQYFQTPYVQQQQMYHQGRPLTTHAQMYRPQYHDQAILPLTNKQRFSRQRSNELSNYHVSVEL